MPYLLAFLPIDGHGTEFPDFWSVGQGNKDQYSVNYLRDPAETTGILLTEEHVTYGAWIPVACFDGASVSSGALVGPLVTAQDGG